MPFVPSATVTHKGKPVAGATVKLVSEPFMGGGMQAAEGTTDDTGGVMPENGTVAFALE